METSLDKDALARALAAGAEWYTQLKADDPGDAESVMRLAEKRLPSVRARALAICEEFGLAPSDFEIPVWDVVISWHRASWVLDLLDDRQ